MSDAVYHPQHYTSGGLECIEAIKASMPTDGFCDYCKGNILKYIWRWRYKGGVQDLRKAMVYLDWLIKAAEEAAPPSAASATAGAGGLRHEKR